MSIKVLSCVLVEQHREHLTAWPNQNAFLLGTEKLLGRFLFLANLRFSSVLCQELLCFF